MTRHYEVWASSQMTYDTFGYEPRGWFTYVIADTPARAKANALRSPDFADYECDGNPFKGLRVKLCLCPHGRCYCDMCEHDFGPCPDCVKEAE